MEPDQYCRDVEAYLCRKNDGHLIRIVGPSFERVCGWAARGIPLKIAFRGVDLYFERYYSKGPRRRPVRIDFCEADVLDVFDAWRRAVGVRVSAAAEETSNFEVPGELQPVRHRAGLARHLDRVLDRIAIRRAESVVPPALPVLDDALDRAAREAAGFKALTPPIRGEARARIAARLVEIDAELLAAARGECPPAVLEALRQEAAEQLQPFRERMPEETYRRALDAAVDRLLREHERLPTLALEY